MIRVSGGPSRYFQGPGALDELGAIVARFGRVPLVISDPVVHDLLLPRLERVFADAGLAPEFRVLPGEITAAVADDLAASGTGWGVTVAVGVGGGKSIDAAKAAALRLGVPVVTVPTIASNDSPTSAAIAMYDDRHTMVAVDRLPANPAAVVVDTAVIAAAPVAFLRAGIGDAIAKKFEADACSAGTGVNFFGSRPLLFGAVVADACYRTVRRVAVAGLAAAERHEATADLEDLVEAVILLSGLGFENGGLSVAHSLTRGLVAARGARAAPHGSHVAWGLLVQLAVEGRPDPEIADLIAFYRATGLPVCLSGLGLADPAAGEIDVIATLTMTAPHLANVPAPVDAAGIAAAICRIEALAQG